MGAAGILAAPRSVEQRGEGNRGGLLGGAEDGTGPPSVAHGGERGTAVAEDAFLPLQAVAADYEDVMRFRCLMDPSEPALGSTMLTPV